MVGVAVAAYLTSYPFLDPILGNSVGILATGPVVLAAWLLGWRAGVITALVFFPLNSAILLLIADRSWTGWLSDGGLLGSSALLFVGSVVGWIRDLNMRLKQSEDKAKRLAETNESQVREIAALNRLFRQEMDERESLEDDYQKLRDYADSLDALISGWPESEANREKSED